MANQRGDAVFTAGYPSGSVLVRYRAGKMDTLGDSSVTGTGPSGTSVNYYFNYRGRFLAMNSRGDVASVAGYSNNSQQIVLQASDGPHLVARQSSVAPGGNVFSNFSDLALDDKGRVMFYAQTTDGRSAAYYWDGTSVQRLIGTGDAGPSGVTVNEVSNVSGGGAGFAVMLAFGNYQTRELRYFDGQTQTTIKSTDTSLFDGTGVSWYWMNECTLAGNGDAHCQVQTQDSGSGVYAHRGTNDLIVARTRDQFPGGEWMVMPLTVSSSAAGEVYFTADTFVNGAEVLTLYYAVPK